jgi:hypothetical protein
MALPEKVLRIEIKGRDNLMIEHIEPAQVGSFLLCQNACATGFMGSTDISIFATSKTAAHIPRS